MDNFFIRTITSIKKNMQSYINERFKEYNLSSSQIFLIHILYKKGSQSQSSLAQILGCDKAHINRNIVKLIDKDYIKYSPPLTENRRNSKLCLTDKGKLLEKKFNYTIVKSMNCLQKGITKDEYEATKKVLEKMLFNSRAMSSNKGAN